MANPGGINFDHEGLGRVAPMRAAGTPLSRGGAHRPALAGTEQERAAMTPPPPGRALTNGASSTGETDPGSGMHRAMNALRSAMPIVQRLLPLLDGNFATAIANVFTQHAPKPSPPVNLAPIEQSVSEIQIQQRELHNQVVEQNVSIRKVEDQLQMVREATDRNTLEQQELMEDLKAVGNKVNVIALVALGLLAVSVLLNLVLYLHIQRVLP